MSINERECEAAGLDPKEVARISRGISRYAKEARKLGLSIFGGSGTGTLRCQSGSHEGALVVADLQGDFDGGDGACREDEDGLLRGE